MKVRPWLVLVICPGMAMVQASKSLQASRVASPTRMEPRSRSAASAAGYREPGGAGHGNGAGARYCEKGSPGPREGQPAWAGAGCRRRVHEHACSLDRQRGAVQAVAAA